MIAAVDGQYASPVLSLPVGFVAGADGRPESREPILGLGLGDSGRSGRPGGVRKTRMTTAAEIDPGVGYLDCRLLKGEKVRKVIVVCGGK